MAHQEISYEGVKITLLANSNKARVSLRIHGRKDEFVAHGRNGVRKTLHAWWRKDFISDKAFELLEAEVDKLFPHDAAGQRP